jgi:UDP-N-acetylmuramate dehydrogenase
MLANVGSFFKNPIVSKQNFQRLLKDYPEMPSFPGEAESIKIPASWMIEQAGWKGFRENDAGVFEKHALILVNYGSATGGDILRLARQIQNSVLDQFGVELEIEPVVI